MLKLIEAMPEFLKHNEVIIKRNITKYHHIGFSAYAPAYLTTTENINGYYDQMDFEGKNVLTVIGASDHIFNAILRGAKKVDGFDISIYAIMFYYLKEAAIKALDYNEFITFFYNQLRYFNKETYSKIMPYLNPVSIPFWNLIFSKKRPEEIITWPCFLKSSHLFFNIDLTIKKQQKISSYLVKENYYKVKEKLKDVEVRIFLRDVKALDNIDGVYDYIIFSNIKDYQDAESSAFDYAVERYLSKLSSSGEIKVAYMYYSPSTKDLEKYDVSEIPSYSRAIEGVGNCPHYVLTKKKSI